MSVLPYFAGEEFTSPVLVPISRQDADIAAPQILALGGQVEINAVALQERPHLGIDLDRHFRPLAVLLTLENKHVGLVLGELTAMGAGVGRRLALLHVRDRRLADRRNAPAGGLDDQEILNIVPSYLSPSLRCRQSAV
jgi:hypothetical protein